MSGGSRSAIQRVRRASADAQSREQDPAPSVFPEPASQSTASTANARDVVREVLPDRRVEERREPVLTRRPEPSRDVLELKEIFPREWHYMLLVMIAAIGAGFAMSSAWPSRLSGVPLILSVLLMAPLPKVWDLVAARSMRHKLAAATFAIFLPLFLFGYGKNEWAVEGGLTWDVTVVAMLAVSSISVVYLRRTPAMIFAAQIALWAAIVAATGSLVGFVALGIGFVLAVLVTREQMRKAAQREEFRLMQERVATRAQDILTDYEETGQGWFWETDRRSLLTYVSPPVAEALGKQAEDLLGQPLTSLFDLQVTGGEGERTLMFHLSARSAFSELAVRAAVSGDERWWAISGRPLYDHFDNFIGFRGSGTDLTERKRSQEHATRLARYDSLTGLANRFQMGQALEKIVSAPQEANRHCSVLLLDLDRFKHVNDTMGHPAGDALLKQVAQRLERAVGKLGQVGRLGGDEFQVIVPTRTDRNQIASLGRDIINSLSQPYSIDGQRVVIGASVGIATAPDDGSTSEALIRNADLALYAAKDAGRGRYHFYSQDLHAEAEARSQLEDDLRDAIHKGELQLFYQPVISCESEKITGFEALMRWQHPVKGWVSPQRFIETAEDTGMIQQIGEWALRKACADLATWPEEVRVAVNVSPVQFANLQLPTVVANALAHAQVHPSRLELEITESVFLQDDAGTDAMFAALKKLGVRLALDDFGTGYSSLGYLKKAPFDKIKIDQSFVRGATQEGSRHGAIIASITSLAHALGMDTTAEGVETLDELELVRMHGCTHVQGFIYERPLSFEDATERLASGLAAVARGPRSSRAPRQTMLRKVVLDHNGNLYNGVVKNISTTGALIEGLWNVPVGTIFKVQISQKHLVTCTARWCEDDRMGVEFANPLQRDGAGRIAAIQGEAAASRSPESLEKAG
ncbi:EAL domain-containing protein [Aurantiacibacter sp. MUD11]|uniref:EAL domain-containing protein n=1 Tax=Aurantiacibacter sp. MUD11 TaxID=3003265 RepID=UPI0022AACA66|nr:EAL domain-containing protein [Aurantiacibacter sp. MUD11]WAT18122.1 EAL domain-containing protein [Aurantiacibacter sp. MUD11]